MERNKVLDRFVQKYCGAKGISAISLDGEYIVGTQNHELYDAMIDAMKEVYGADPQLANLMMEIEIDSEPYIFMRAGDYIFFAHTMFEPHDDIIDSKLTLEAKVARTLAPRPPTPEKEIQAQSRFWQAGKREDTMYADCNGQGTTIDKPKPIMQKKGKWRF